MKAYKFSHFNYSLVMSLLEAVVAPKPAWDAGSATTRQIHYMGGSLTTPTAPQRIDVDPNRCGEPMNPLKGTPTLQGGEEVS
jgi:hypothetical protein